MRVLNPNTGEDIVAIAKGNIFVYVTDYGQKMIFKEIIVDLGQHHWEWLCLDSNKPIDLHGIGNRYSTFDYALNRAVNDVNCTVYEFNNKEEMIEYWKSIKYINNIKTIYKSVFELEEKE